MPPFDEDDEMMDPGMAYVDDSGKKMGVKKQRKLEMKEERKRAREYELQEREERKKKAEELEQARKLEEQQLEAEEKAKAEAERLEKEKKEREEYEEYLKLKESFAIEEEGCDGDVGEEESQNRLAAFIDYIKAAKVVHMDELAGHFNLRTAEVVSRIQDLLAAEQLVGVIDDRGKFIYITEEELGQVARFIRQRGRVSISELAENSNSFINLKPQVET
ncbi:PREDICTED: DDRGK domain-containing protein 1-like [Rhagoletis zephyria]|uniref:DDRGK domain-containing protein 1-like n=1 Tax=Rhagoletis zephyria TaxID=28612 RepID=UPI0008117910|nr:PREDICTED: DDRGK domain-containing protein 1-like [Rhagoletis zephyria]